MLNLSENKVRIPEAEEQYYALRLVRTPRRTRTVTYWILATLLLGIGMLFLPWRQNITAKGRVTSLSPQDRPQVVNATIDGRIKGWEVAEGQWVEEGQPIMTLEEVKEKFFDPEILARTQEQINANESAIQAVEDKIVALESQVAALESGLGLSGSKAVNKVQQSRLKVATDSAAVTAAEADMRVAAVQLSAMEKLYNEGVEPLRKLEERQLKNQSAIAKYQEAINKLSISRNEYLNAAIEVNSVTADYNEKISKALSEMHSSEAYLSDLEAKQAKLLNEFSNIEIRSGFYTIRAPQSGYVVRALKSGVGEMVKAGDPVVTVMPSDPKVAVELFVSANDIPIVHKGNDVRLQFDGWPALQFAGWPGISVGTFGGTIAVVDYVDTYQGQYRVLVVPNEQDQEKWPQGLRVGSGVYGWAMLKQVPVWYELWRQFNGFPPEFYGMPAGPDSQKSPSKQKDSKTSEDDQEK
jgi:multidrug resistance efflux pump